MIDLGLSVDLENKGWKGRSKTSQIFNSVASHHLINNVGNVFLAQLRCNDRRLEALIVYTSWRR